MDGVGKDGVVSFWVFGRFSGAFAVSFSGSVRESRLDSADFLGL